MRSRLKNQIRAGAKVLALFSFGLASCSSVPEAKFTKYEFPKGAFLGAPQKRPYEKLGQVRGKVNYNSLDAKHEEAALCRNYYNKAVSDLIKKAKEQGGNAVIDVKSVVFLLDGQHEIHSDPQCSDDGAEGQILVQGIAIKWIKPKRNGMFIPPQIPDAPEATPEPSQVPAPNSQPLPQASLPPPGQPVAEPSAKPVEITAPYTTRIKR